MTKYHNPKTKKTVEAGNKREALQKMAPAKPKAPTTSKASSKVHKATKTVETKKED